MRGVSSNLKSQTLRWTEYWNFGWILMTKQLNTKIIGFLRVNVIGK